MWFGKKSSVQTDIEDVPLSRVHFAVEGSQFTALTAPIGLLSDELAAKREGLPLDNICTDCGAVNEHDTGRCLSFEPQPVRPLWLVRAESEGFVAKELN